MQTTFLAASNGQALAKNLITGDTYPNVTNVTSFTHDVTNLKTLIEVFKIHAEEGNCLIKGELDRPLINESRAGHSKQSATYLLVLDIDHNSLPFKSRNDLVDTLGFKGISYIFQHSASSKSESSLRGHYFILLDKPTQTSLVKEKVKALNFEHLYNYIELSNNKLSLKWPLDITVNDNGKVIYLATPIQEQDPIQERFLLVERANPSYTFQPSTDEYNVHDVVNQLRDNNGLPTKTAPTNNLIKIDPDEVKITNLEERDNNFIYLNLNGGDSWGYYFNRESPNIVYNFKGEPNFFLSDLCPTTYDKFKITEVEGGGELNITASGTLEISKSIGFRDPVLDRYWQVKYNPENFEVNYMHSTSSKDRVNDFLITNGEERLKHITDWDLEFNPTSLDQIRPNDKWINAFKPTSYMIDTDRQSTVPKHCEILLRHLTVDQECFDAFTNWLAYIFQFRKKTGTAWVLHGTTGTGKGTLFDVLLQPLFGYDYTHMGNTDQVTEDKNLFMEQNLICVIDEFELKNDIQGSQQYARLRSYITEPIIPIRAMRMNAVKRKSYANFIMTTNRPTCMKVEEEDRRMNFAPRQTLSLPVADPDAFREELKKELTQFANFLRQYKVNKGAVKSSLKNEARAKMIQQSRSSHEEFFFAIKTSNLDFFTDQFMEKPDPMQIPEYLAYQKEVLSWVDDASNDLNTKITKETLLNIYLWVTGANKKTITLNKFTSICANNGLDFQRRIIKYPACSGGSVAKRKQLIEVTWTGQVEGFLTTTAPEPSNVIKINDA